MAAGLAQAGDLGQDAHALVAARPGLGVNPFQGLAAQGLVEGGLLRAQLHLEEHLGARRQLLEHLRLEAAEDERLDELFQPAAGLTVVVPFDGRGEALVEPFAAAEQAGVDEVEQGEEFAQVVFNRRAGGDQPELRL